MTELLAVLTSIFVIYVLYEIFKTVSESELESGGAAVGTAAKPQAAKPIQTAPPPQVAVVAEALAKPVPVAAEPAKINTLRNPSTGEISPVPGNYRFAKKWIKEAIVAEGLLKKVYKNSELTEAVSPHVKDALEQFKKLPQYH